MNNEIKFTKFQKIPRLMREIIITEKLHGSNASVLVAEDGQFLTGSRTRWITPQNDNFGFSKWAHDNKEELMKLGVGHHFGEWMGCGINEGYGLNEKRFYLFNTSKWSKERPSCCHVVPVLYEGIFSEEAIHNSLRRLKEEGSLAVPGYMNPEGICIYHTAANVYFKMTIDNDGIPKSMIK